jgi:hypothetical protein
VEVEVAAVEVVEGYLGVLQTPRLHGALLLKIRQIVRGNGLKPKRLCFCNPNLT